MRKKSKRNLFSVAHFVENDTYMWMYNRSRKRKVNLILSYPCRNYNVDFGTAKVAREKGVGVSIKQHN